MKQQRGFSLIELMVAVAVFTLITGAAFLLLNASQSRYTSEAQLLDSFQSARLAYDQMSLDIHTAGYPAQNEFTSAAIVAQNPTWVAQTPFAWNPGYPGAPCNVGANCNTPGPFDLIIETMVPPNAGIQWVRYQLGGAGGTTLQRAMVPKFGGGDPAAATGGANLVPYVDNVINNITAAQMAPIQAQYPGMFPGNNPVPLFTYSYDANAPCNGPALPIPSCIKEVQINMIVQSPSNDLNTGRPRVTSLTGQVIRFNPAQ